MRSHTHALVKRQLESSKSDGLIAEYFISWPAHDAPPTIVVWARQASADYIRGFIAGDIDGIEPDCITVIDEPPPLLINRRKRVRGPVAAAFPERRKRNVIDGRRA